jgi:hypothetical protein
VLKKQKSELFCCSVVLNRYPCEVGCWSFLIFHFSAAKFSIFFLNRPRLLGSTSLGKMIDTILIIHVLALSLLPFLKWKNVTLWVYIYIYIHTHTCIYVFAFPVLDFGPLKQFLSMFELTLCNWIKLHRRILEYTTLSNRKMADAQS